MNRRSFLKRASLAAASCVVVSPEVLGGPGKIAPSDQFRFAQIGAGGRGRVDLAAVIAAGGKAVALCDVDVQRAGKTYELHPDLPRYTDYREMLRVVENEIDGVVISTPDHLHCVQGLEALRRGKHVYLQKPLARTYDECDRLRRSAINARVATQMGNQRRSGLGMVAFRDFVDRGVLGKIKEVHCWTNRPVWPQGMTSRPAPTQPPITLDWDRWLGPIAEQPFARGYAPFAWRGWWDFGCGALGDMGCHLMDPAFALLGLTMPTSIVAQSESPATVAFPHWSIVRFEFPATPLCPDGITVTWYDGDKKPDLPTISPNDDAEDPGYLPDGNGCCLIGERMTIAGGSRVSPPEIIAVAGDDPEELLRQRRLSRQRIAELPLRANFDSRDHYRRWIDAAKSGPHDSLGSPFQTASVMTQAILLGCIASRYPEQSLTWNATTEQFEGLDGANRFLAIDPRDGYDLTVVG